MKMKASFFLQLSKKKKKRRKNHHCSFLRFPHSDDPASVLSGDIRYPFLRLPVFVFFCSFLHSVFFIFVSM